MKLLVKSGSLVKQIELNQDMVLDVQKGEQYLFSGIDKYLLKLGEDQEDVLFSLDAGNKMVNVELRRLVPSLQENASNTEQLTTVVINKSFNEQALENIFNNQFNGSEIIDSLKALNSDEENNFALITDFTSLIDTLEAAAAGQLENSASNFDTIFSPIEDNLNDIAGTNKWENLSESISSQIVDGADEIIARSTITENESVKNTQVQSEENIQADIVKPTIRTTTFIDEEGLNTSSTDTTKVQGVLLVDDEIVELTGPVGFTSNGQEITWNWDVSTKTLTGTTNTSSNIMTINVKDTDISDGVTYEVILNAPLDHNKVNEEDVLSLNFKAETVQNVDVDMVVKVKDDMPISNIVNNEISFEPETTNILIMLDRSGTMAYKNSEGLASMEVAKDAINKLMEEYDKYGEVNINFVSFDDEIQSSNTWLSLTEAKAWLDNDGNTQAFGGTDYFSTLKTVTDTYQPPLNDGKTVAYFISDGTPSKNEDELLAYEQSWENFINTNDISKSYAIGIGNVDNTFLNATAYENNTQDGSAYSKSLSSDSLADELLQTIQNVSELEEVLLDTVNANVEGSIITKTEDSIVKSIFGADKGSLVDINGQSYEADENGYINVQTQNGGTLEINTLTGDYSYDISRENALLHKNETEQFNIKIVDNDNDESTITINIKINAPDVHSSNYTYDSYTNDTITDINLGNEDNVLNLQSNTSSQINTGAGNDTVNVNEYLEGTGVVDLSSGDDTFLINSTSGNRNEPVGIFDNAKVDGGSGEDTLVLTARTVGVNGDTYDDRVIDLTSNANFDENIENFEKLNISSKGIDLKIDDGGVLNITDNPDTILKIYGNDIKIYTGSTTQKWEQSLFQEGVEEGFTRYELNGVKIDVQNSVASIDGQEVINYDTSDTQASRIALEFTIEKEGLTQSKSIFTEDDLLKNVSGSDIKQLGDLEQITQTDWSNEDRVEVAGDLKTILNTSDGNDIVNIIGSVKKDLDTGTGEDKVYVAEYVNYDISLGDGNDILQVDGKLLSYIDGGDGVDSLILNSYTKADYDNNVGWIKMFLVQNFENIKFADGQIIGDSTVFDNIENITESYSYNFNVYASLTDIDNSETLSKLTIENIPDGVSSIRRSDGETFSVENNSVEIDIVPGSNISYKVVSSFELTDVQINLIKASVSSSEISSGEVFTTTVNAKLVLEATDLDDEIQGTNLDEYIDGKDGADIIDAKGGDDTIVYDGADISIDGGSGTDTLVVKNETIDLSEISAKANNIEAIDMTNNLKGVINIKLEDVLNLTDEGNQLVIRADIQDKVNLEGTDIWTNDGSQQIDGVNYNIYTGVSADSSVRLLVEDQIEVTPDI